MIKFKTYTHLDQEGLGCNAFTILVPDGWDVSGGLIWRDHPTMPAAVNLSIKSPDGLNEVRLLPSRPYTWFTAPMMFYSPSEGSFYMGNEIRRPVNGFEEYIRYYILPYYGQNVRYKGSKRLPDLADAIRQENPGGSADAGCVRIEYDWGGHTFEEDILCAVVTANLGISIYWFVDKIFTLRSEKSYLDDNYKMFDVIIKSFKLDINWYNAYCQLVQVMVNNKLNESRHALIRSRIIANANNQISDMIMQSYERQQATYDRVYQGISESIRGVNTYYDPYKGYGVQLPNQYRYVYGNALGEYILTDDPLYNPNIGSNVNWQNLNRM